MSDPLQFLERIAGERGPIAKRKVRNQISDGLACWTHSARKQPGDELPTAQEPATAPVVSDEKSDRTRRAILRSEPQ